MVLGGGAPGALAVPALSFFHYRGPRNDLGVTELWGFSAELPSARQHNQSRLLPKAVCGSPTPLPLPPQAQCGLEGAGGLKCGLETKRLPTPRSRAEETTRHGCNGNKSLTVGCAGAERVRQGMDSH